VPKNLPYECKTMADACLWGRDELPTASQHPKNRAKSISQRVIGAKEEPRLRQIVARLRIAACFACGSMRWAREDASRARELTRRQDKTYFGVFVPVRNFFGVCFHGRSHFLNAGVFRVGFCAEPCAVARTQTLRGACPSAGSAVLRKARVRPAPARSRNTVRDANCASSTRRAPPPGSEG
jgi:hypothetical protein